jgi:hypothetical protein
MSKDRIKRELLAIGIALYIKEVDHNEAMNLLEKELIKYEKLVKNCSIHVVSKTK